MNEKSKKPILTIMIGFFALMFMGATLDRSAQAQEASGDIVSTTIDLPGNRILSYEHSHAARLTNKILPKYWKFQPEQMSFSVTNTGTETPTMFTALTLGEANPAGEKHPKTHQAGMIIQAEFSRETKQFDESTLLVEFPECTEMPGIQTSESGDVIAVLCKTDPDNRSALLESVGREDNNVVDLVASYQEPNQLIVNADWQIEMWLYEWTNGDITSEPSKFIISKAIGRDDSRPYNLVYGANDGTHGTYGVSLSRLIGAKGYHHHDSFFVINRAATPDEFSIAKMRHDGQKPRAGSFRGWANSCSAGHSRLIRLGYNPLTQEYGTLCESDAHNLNDSENRQDNDVKSYWGINFARETSDGGENNEKKTFLLLQSQTLRHKQGLGFSKGGPGPIVPFGDGWIGLVVGAEGSEDDLAYLDGHKIPSAPVTQIGFVQFDQSGNLVGKADGDPRDTVGTGINWFVNEDPYYVSYPQLIPIDPANGTYLLGYGILPANSTQNSRYDQLVWNLRFPNSYMVQEVKIEASGDGSSPQVTALSEPTILNAQWGELDEMVYLGNNQVGWASCPNPTATCSSLQLNVYTLP